MPIPERAFSADKVTLNKQEVRKCLYDDVRDLLRRPGLRFGMLAGGAPQEEISCIRLRFFRPAITAFDLDTRAVEAAQRCSVETVLGNIGYAKVFGEREFDFFDVDLCKTLTTSKRPIQQAARNTTSAMSVFVSFGRDGKEGEKAAARAEECRGVIRDEATNGSERVIGSEATNRLERVAKKEPTKVHERVSRAKTTTRHERVRFRRDNHT